MSHYRIYELGRDGHIVIGTSIEAPDDETATEHAINSVGENGIEIWQDTRRVLTIAAQDTTQVRKEHPDRKRLGCMCD